MARKKGDINTIFEHSIDEVTRTIFMHSNPSSDGEDYGVDHVMATNAIKALMYLDSRAPDGDKPISIILNSPGGEEYHGLAIYDAIKTCKNHVKIFVFGMAASMASIILQAADERILAPNARIMIHYGTREEAGHAKIVSAWNKEYDKMDKEMEVLYLEKIREKKPSFTLKKLQEMLYFDTIFDAKKAMAYGLADEVLGND